ncbi:enoyl-CoA hydratase-related protein [Alphaproteobacteria bacterium]|nr:enoyl-CoA hydratase-related protein [Alphaproteobacteria bacterium]MDC0147647.1 enoyl-CoA hydratase-related protein [Alphaproteobacteria bacterium]
MTEIVTQTLSDSGVLTICMNRPEVLNSLNRPIVEQLIAAFNAASENDDVRCVIFTGAGRGFCAGADLANGEWPREEGWTPGDVTWHSMEKGYNVLGRALVNCDKPVICAVNGIAAGAGVGLALSADLTIAAKSASFKLVFGPQLGIIPDVGASWHVPQLVGRARANGLAMLGDSLPAEKAEKWGMIWEVVDDETLMEAAMAYGERMAASAITGLKAVSRAHDKAMENSLDAQLDYERDMQGHFCNQPVFFEGVSAFIEKRKPNFREIETAQIKAARESE